MSITTRSGVEVPLLRPVAVANPLKGKRKRLRPWKNEIRPDKLNTTTKPVKSVYNVKKIKTHVFLSPLISLTYRSIVATTSDRKRSPSDVGIDILIYYLDQKYPGWDAQSGERPIANFGSYKNKKVTTYLGAMNLAPYTAGQKKTRYPGPKVVQMLKLPISVYTAVRSIAQVQKIPMSDVMIEACMFYFDEVYPGWDLAGDIPESETDAK